MYTQFDMINIVKYKLSYLKCLRSDILKTIKYKYWKFIVSSDWTIRKITRSIVGKVWTCNGDVIFYF